VALWCHSVAEPLWRRDCLWLFTADQERQNDRSDDAVHDSVSVTVAGFFHGQLVVHTTYIPGLSSL
jgi:hypothetical protein